MVGIPMGIKCASPTFISDLFLFRYERDFTLSLSYENQANIIESIQRLNIWIFIQPFASFHHSVFIYFFSLCCFIDKLENPMWTKPTFVI